MRLLPAFGAALVLAVLVPQAAAQDQLGPALTLAIDAPRAPIKPEIESPLLLAVATARCDLILQQASPTSPDSDVPATVTFATAEGVAITGAQTILFDPLLCAQPGARNVTVRQPYQITIPRTAPGLQAIGIVATASFGSAPPVGSAPDATAPFTVTPDYYSLNQAKLAGKLKQCKPGGHASYDVELVNYGNARTQYTFEVGAEPGGKWSIDLPPTLVLDSAATGSTTSQTVTFRVACTGLNSEGSFQVVIRPAAFDDLGKQGDPLTMNFLARSRGAIPIPAPGPALGLALLGVALLLARRR